MRPYVWDGNFDVFIYILFTNLDVKSLDEYADS